jgi:hypothetical protein
VLRVLLNVDDSTGRIYRLVAGGRSRVPLFAPSE